MKKLLYLFFFWLIVSCEKEEVKPQITVDSIILVEVQEIMAGSEKKLILNCQTEKTYPCANYYIRAIQEVSDNKFSVMFTNIGTDGVCATALGPARTKIYLGSLDYGTYPLSIHVNGLRNTGTLTITNSQILLDIPQQNGIKITNPVYTR